MEFFLEVVLEVISELFSEGIDAAITAWKERKRKKGENKDVSEELNH